jgi:hypothetical protein
LDVPSEDERDTGDEPDDVGYGSLQGQDQHVVRLEKAQISVQQREKTVNYAPTDQSKIVGSIQPYMKHFLHFSTGN